MSNRVNVSGGIGFGTLLFF